MISLFEHQTKALELTKQHTRCAYYLDMGLGKTFVGAEKAVLLNAPCILVVCQKSKVDDWVNHFKTYYNEQVFDLTKKRQLDDFLLDIHGVGIINYELVFRRQDLLKLHRFTLLLDESSLIANETTKRSKFVLKMTPDNVVLLSGTPTAGKYEKLWSQCRLLGWDISKKCFYSSYVIEKPVSYYGGFVQKQVVGYKNVEHLKLKLRQLGCVFMKTEEVMTLPAQNEQSIFVKATSEYKRFKKDSYIVIDGKEFVGDNTLTKILYQRMLCGAYNKDKLQAFTDLLDSTEDRVIVFYNYNSELDALESVCNALKRPYSVVNGKVKDLHAYDTENASVTFIQYQAGAYGLNLQKANKVIYFSLPLGKGSCDLWEQSKKRIHRIGQSKPCFYYYLLVENSIETWNYTLLLEGKELTDKLFEEVQNGSGKTVRR